MCVPGRQIVQTPTISPKKEKKPKPETVSNLTQIVQITTCNFQIKDSLSGNIGYEIQHTALCEDGSIWKMKEYGEYLEKRTSWRLLNEWE